jgi:hypothetical protein
MCDGILENAKLLELVIGYFEQMHQQTLSRRITLVSRFITYLFKYDRNKVRFFIFSFYSFADEVDDKVHYEERKINFLLDSKH